MNVYAETSAVLRWLLGAPRGADVRATLSGAERVFASRLTLVEARRALIRAAVTGDIAEAAALAAGAALSSAAAGWTLVEVLPEIARRAEETFPAEPVRTLDGLHLATALFLLPEVGLVSVLSTDARIVKNAPLLGLPLALSG
jgi:predicted nucleic acid-binding protein